LVLLVDDHDDTGEMYVEGLRLCGFETIGAADGQEACRQACQFHPDIVVTDLSPCGATTAGS
jgi:CheY-like chemotaxis protein